MKCISLICLPLFHSSPRSIPLIFHFLPGSISFPFHCLPMSIYLLFHCLPGSISFIAQVYFFTIFLPAYLYFFAISLPSCNSVLATILLKMKRLTQWGGLSTMDESVQSSMRFRLRFHSHLTRFWHILSLTWPSGQPITLLLIAYMNWKIFCCSDLMERWDSWCTSWGRKNLPEKTEIGRQCCSSLWAYWW